MVTVSVVLFSIVVAVMLAYLLGAARAARKAFKERSLERQLAAVVPPVPVPTVTIAWMNQSRLNGELTLSDIDAAKIVEALNIQVPDLLAMWPHLPVINNVFCELNAAPAGSIKAYFLPNSDVAEALGYHSVDPQGDPYIRIFTEPVLTNGGTSLRGAISISVCASHEMCEEAVDPTCQLAARAPNGDQWALETADPVENNCYEVTLADGSKVAVSDFVFPSFFGNGSGPYDKLGVLVHPFSIAPGGYAVIDGVQKFGERYPDWKKPGKEFPAARTYRRTHA